MLCFVLAAPPADVIHPALRRVANFNKLVVTTFTEYRTEHSLSPDGTEVIVGVGTGFGGATLPPDGSEVGVGVGTGFGGATCTEENRHKPRFEYL